MATLKKPLVLGVGRLREQAAGELTGYCHVGSWSGRPAASGAGAGACLYISTGVLANTEWISDGVNWLPRGGRQCVLARVGTAMAPLANVTTVTAGDVRIVLPDVPVMPAGAIAPNCTVICAAMVHRTDSAAVAVYPSVRFGTAGTNQDGIVAGATFPAGVAGYDTAMRGRALFSSASDRYLAQYWCVDNGVANGAFMQRTVNAATGSDMQMSVWINAAQAGVTCSVYAYSLSIEMS